MAHDDIYNTFETPFDNPLVPRFPMEMRNTEILTAFYRTDPDCARRLVPEPLEVISDLVIIHIYHMNDSDWFGNYYESAVQIPVRLPGTDIAGAYSPYLYLGSDGAVATGREIYGQPKKGGQPCLEVREDLFVGTVTRNGIDVITVTMAYKQQRATFDALAAYGDFRTNVNLKVVPNVDGTAAVRQLTARTFADVRVHECWRGAATVELRPNAQAPVYRLPVREVIEGFYWRTDFVLPFGQIIHDYLTEGTQPMNMEGKVALVTGGGSGIGQAACLEFARAGSKVMVVDINAEAMEKTVSLISALGQEARAFQADVSQSADVHAYVENTVRSFGRIDAFFNNAGIEGTLSPLAEYSEANWDRVIGINLKGTFLGLRHVLPVMLTQKSGSIINTASVAGTVGAPGLAAYSASKHAIIGLTRTAAGEVGRQGVRVNAVCPGPINTRMIHSLEAMINPDEPAAVGRANVARNPTGRYGEPEEVAKVVVFLASDASTYVNGVAWLIDGGRTAV